MYLPIIITLCFDHTKHNIYDDSSQAGYLPQTVTSWFAEVRNACSLQRLVFAMSDSYTTACNLFSEKAQLFTLNGNMSSVYVFKTNLKKRDTLLTD